MVKSDIDIDPRGPPFVRDDVEIAQIRRSMKKSQQLVRTQIMDVFDPQT